MQNEAPSQPQPTQSNANFVVNVKLLSNETYEIETTPEVTNLLSRSLLPISRNY
jgi:hypothetical protein